VSEKKGGFGLTTCFSIALGTGWRDKPTRKKGGEGQSSFGAEKNIKKINLSFRKGVGGTVSIISSIYEDMERCCFWSRGRGFEGRKKKKGRWFWHCEKDQ